MRELSGIMARRKLLAGAIAVLLGFGFGTAARADLVLDISSVVGADVQFTGTGTSGSFQFNNNGSGQGFDITSSSGVGDSTGLYGTIGGTFSYTTTSIQTYGPVETAPLTTSGGELTITDANHQVLTATIAGLDVTTLGTSGAVNVTGAINLTNVVYNGTDADLKALKADVNQNGGVFSLTFQFTPALNLTNLATNKADNTTSYSASLDTSSFGVTSVPEPSSLALGCIGTMALIGYGRWRRKDRSGTGV